MMDDYDLNPAAMADEDWGGAADDESTSGMGSGGQAMVLCCMCGASIHHNPANMCANCIKNKVDISQGITKECVVFFCRGCGRYQRPPYVSCGWESPELLALCLKKIRGLNRVKLVDASFIYTEEHSRRIKLKLTIQKEVFKGAIMEKSFPVLFKMQNQQCTDCQKSYTEHTWEAMVQTRQKVGHKRSFYFLEQLLLKHGMTRNCMGVRQQPDGLDFYFVKTQDAQALIKFLEQVMPVQSKASKRLISQDDRNNVYRYKHTLHAEIAPVCKHDLVMLPPKHVSAAGGGISPLVLCYRVSNQLHFVDPESLSLFDLPSVQYWKHPFRPVLASDRLVEFVVMQVDAAENRLLKQQQARRQTRDSERFKLAQVSVCRPPDFERQYECLSHLGNVLREGDTVLGYDLETENCGSEDWRKSMKNRQLPEVVLVRKVFPQTQKRNRRRNWELKRIVQADDPRRPVKNSELRAQERDYEAFLQDLEEDPEDRQRINLYRSAEAERKAKAAAGAGNADPASAAMDEKEAEMNADDDDDDEDDNGANNDEDEDEDDDTFNQVNVKLEELLSHMSMAEADRAAPVLRSFVEDPDGAGGDVDME